MFCMCRVVMAVWILAFSSSSYSREVVPLVSLIVNGEDFIGRDLSVYGYFTAAPRLNLYLSSDHVFDSVSAISVLDDESTWEAIARCGGQYLTIHARFKQTRDGMYYFDVPEKMISSKGSVVCFER